MDYIEQMRAEGQRRQERQEQQHAQDRDVLFQNEKFVIGVLQVVSGGATLAAIGQAQQLIRLTSDATMRTFVTLSCAALFFALTAAVFKHQYKMWDVKFRAIDNAVEQAAEALRRSKLANRYLWSMRYCIWASFAAIAIDLLQLVAALWLN